MNNLAPFANGPGMDCCTPNYDSTVDQLLGNAYQVVKFVAMRMPFIKALSDNIDDLIALAGSLEGLNELAASLPQLMELQAELQKLLTLYANLADLVQIADNLPQILTVHDNLPQIQIIIDNLAQIQTVVTNITQITAVGNNINAVNGVYNNLAAILNVNTNMAAVTDVSTHMTDVRSVATNMPGIQEVAANISEIQVVGQNIDDVSSVADNITDVNTVADNSVAVVDVSTNINAILEVQTKLADLTLIATQLQEMLDFADNLASDTGSSNVGFKQVIAAAVLRTVQDKLRETISIKDLGAVGDGIADDTIAFEAAALSGLPVHIPPGEYRTDPFAISVNKSRLIGAGSEKVTLLINAISNAPSIWGLASDSELSGVTIKINPAPIGEHDGLYSTGLTVGRYFYASAYAPIQRVRVHDVRVVRESDTNLVNSFTIIGNVSDVVIENCGAVGGLSGIVCHWGPDQVGTYGQPITGQTFHPNNIRIKNFTVSGAQGGWPVFISACYDVHVSNVRSDNCPGSVAIVAGDVGNRYAPDAIKDKILTGISVDGVFSDVTAPDALLLDGEGNYEGVWQRVPMRGVSLDNVELYASAGTTAAVAIARDVVGSVEIGSLVVRTGDFTTIGLELERCKGVHIRNYSSNAANGYVVDRSKHVRIDKINLADPQATDQTTGNLGVSVTGNRYTSTLGANIVLGATSITLATAFGVRAYKGDIIRVTSTPAQYVTITDLYVPNSGTNIVVGIEPADFTASSGAGIQLDNFAEEVEIDGGWIKGYPKGVYSVTSNTYQTRNLKLRRVLFEACHDRDIDVERVDGMDIIDCEFRAGGTRSQNSVNQTRVINMSNCRDFRIVNNRIGNESRFYTYGLVYGDANSVEGLVADNTFGVGLGIGGIDVNASLKAAGRDNVYRNNRQFLGGTVTPVLT